MVLRLLFWAFLAVVIPLLAISMVSPVFDRLGATGRFPLSASWGLFGGGVVINALAWLMHLILGRARAKRPGPGEPDHRFWVIFRWSVIGLYWVGVAIGWVAIMALG